MLKMFFTFFIWVTFFTFLTFFFIFQTFFIEDFTASLKRRQFLQS